MKKIIALSGPSGAGKTYLRTHDPILKELPYLDIADMYREYPSISPQMAFAVFLTRAGNLLSMHNTIVLEAYFRRASQQRFTLEVLADEFGADIEYKELYAPKEILRQRIIQDSTKYPDDPFWKQYTEARLMLVELEKE